MGFWNAIRDAYTASTAHIFALHGAGVADLHTLELPTDDGVQTAEVDLVDWFNRMLSGWNCVMQFTDAGGIEFATQAHRQWFMEHVMQGSTPAPAPGFGALLGGGGGQPEPEQMSNIEQAFPLIDRALAMVNQPRDNGATWKVALLLPDADLQFAGGPPGANPGGRLAAGFFRRWGAVRNNAFRNRNAPLIILLANNLQTMSSEIARVAYSINIPAPRYDERVAYINTLLARMDNVALDNGLTVDALAGMTAGMLRINIEDVVVQAARLNDNVITATLAQQRRNEIMDTLSGGLLERVEPKHGLDDVVGQGATKAVLREQVLAPMLAGEPAPKGVLFMGSPGLGKTHMAEALAREAGIPVVYWRSGGLLGKYMGESESKVEQALGVLTAMERVIVIVDEAERQVGFKSQNQQIGGSSVDGNVSARIQNYMSQTPPGAVLWVLATNYPGKLEPAVIRPGRVDMRVLFTLPDHAERVELLRVMARKHGASLTACDEDALAEVARELDGHSGAEVEAVVQKAIRYGGSLDITEDVLYHAATVILPTGKRDKDAMLAAGLREINDLDLVPEQYRARLIATQQDPEEPTNENVAPGRATRTM